MHSKILLLLPLRLLLAASTLQVWNPSTEELQLLALLTSEARLGQVLGQVLAGRGAGDPLHSPICGITSRSDVCPSPLSAYRFRSGRRGGRRDSHGGPKPAGGLSRTQSFHHSVLACIFVFPLLFAADTGVSSPEVCPELTVPEATRRGRDVVAKVNLDQALRAAAANYGVQATPPVSAPPAPSGHVDTRARVVASCSAGSADTGCWGLRARSLREGGAPCVSTRRFCLPPPSGHVHPPTFPSRTTLYTELAGCGCCSTGGRWLRRRGRQPRAPGARHCALSCRTVSWVAASVLDTQPCVSRPSCPMAHGSRQTKKKTFAVSCWEAEERGAAADGEPHGADGEQDCTVLDRSCAASSASRRVPTLLWPCNGVSVPVQDAAAAAGAAAALGGADVSQVCCVCCASLSDSRNRGLGKRQHSKQVSSNKRSLVFQCTRAHCQQAADAEEAAFFRELERLFEWPPCTGFALSHRLAFGALRRSLCVDDGV